jgi:quinol monooxygenase YgiN
MAESWTHGTWTVKPGREGEFLVAFRALVRELGDELGVAPPTLLHDREQPNVFLTFGPWASEDEIERFREPLFPRLGPLRELLEAFEPRTLDRVGLDD